MKDQQSVVKEAKQYPLEFKSLSSYVSWFIGSIDSCGLSVSRSSLEINHRGMPLRKPMHKGRGDFVVGTYHTIEAPALCSNRDMGIIIEERLNLRVRETVFVMDGKLFLSSYAYHFELINEKKYPYLRYEKRPLSHENEAYAPLFHLHVAGRLPHMPAPRVDIKKILDNVKANLFDPNLVRKLSDGLWSELA